MAISSIAQRSSACRCGSSSRRSAVVVRASTESRRAVLGGFLAGAALTVSGAAVALTPVDVFDDRKVKETGYDIIYEARDTDLPQNVREGFTQARANLEETKSRVKASQVIISSKLEPSIQSAYWTEAREELRRQVGTLRFDLNALASAKTNADKKIALAAKKTFINQVEALDLALVKKDKTTALAALDSTKTALDSVLATLL